MLTLAVLFTHGHKDALSAMNRGREKPFDYVLKTERYELAEVCCLDQHRSISFQRFRDNTFSSFHQEKDR